MVSRKDLVRAAACAALACAGLVPAAAARADERAPVAQGTPAAAAERPQREALPLFMTEEAPEEAKGRRPLMAAIDRTGAGEMLDRWGIDVSGHVAVSYMFSDSAPPDGALNEDFLTGRVFDSQHDEFWFNQADITIQRTLTPDDDDTTGYADRVNVGFLVEYLYGQDGRLIHANGVTDHDTDDTSRNEEDDLVQAYVTVGIPVGNGLLITGGKFVTLIGYEYINPTLNPLYSHSFLFGFAIPFTHTGILAKYNFTENVNATVGIVRGWEQAADDNNEAESFIAQVGYTWNPNSGGRPINITLTGITGPEQTDNEGDFRTLLDLIIATQVSDELSVALNADLGWEDDATPDGEQAEWYGVAAYATYAFNDNMKLNLRGEWFNDKEFARGLGTNVYEVTAGLSIKPFPDNELGSNLVFRPEVRYDWAQESVFDNGTDHDQLTVGGDLIFAF